LSFYHPETGPRFLNRVLTDFFPSAESTLPPSPLGLGLELGLELGLCEGLELGEADGLDDGEVLGLCDGEPEGELEGELDGELEGDVLGLFDGEVDGLLLGLALPDIPIPVTTIVPPLLAEGELDGDGLL